MRKKARELVAFISGSLDENHELGFEDIKKFQLTVRSFPRNPVRKWGIAYSLELSESKQGLGFSAQLPDSYFFSYRGALKVARVVREYYSGKGVDTMIVGEAA